MRQGEDRRASQPAKLSLMIRDLVWLVLLRSVTLVRRSPLGQVSKAHTGSKTEQKEKETEIHVYRFRICNQPFEKEIARKSEKKLAKKRDALAPMEQTEQHE